MPYEQDDKFGILRHFWCLELMLFFIKIDFVGGLEGSLGAILSQNGIAQFWDLTVNIPRRVYLWKHSGVTQFWL